MVSDLDASIDFYVRFLGLRVKREFSLSAEESAALFQMAVPARAVQLLFDEGMLELFAFETEALPERGLPGGLFHFAMQIDQSLDDFMAAARRRGIPVSTIERNGKTICFIQDPDGVFIEVKA